MCQRGLPLQISNVRYLAQLLLSAQLKSSEKAAVGEQWVNWFIQRHPELKSKYTHQYDYQRAKCENPELIKNWFTWCPGDHSEVWHIRAGHIQYG